MTLRQLHTAIGHIIDACDCPRPDQWGNIKNTYENVPDLPVYLTIEHSKRYKRAIPVNTLPYPGFQTLMDYKTKKHVMAFVMDDGGQEHLIT